MRNSGKFAAILTPRKPRYFPKKLLISQDIPINDRYGCRATIWIADTPEGKLMPTVNLVLSHGDQRISFSFNNAASMAVFVKEIGSFIDEKLVSAYEKHEKALREFLRYHAELLPPDLNDITDSTVIQGKPRGKVGFWVNRDTGELTNSEIPGSAECVRLRSKQGKQIEFQEVLRVGQTVPRREILKLCLSMGYGVRTIDRELKRALGLGVLISPKFGCYSLPTLTPFPSGIANGKLPAGG